MDTLKSLNRRERMIGAAILNVLFAISLFFEWGGGDFRGWDRDSAWLPFACAVIAALILFAEAFDYELPRFPVSGVAAYLTSLTLFYVLISLVDVRDQQWGIIFALIVSAVATVLAVSVWMSDRAGGGAPTARS